MHTMLIDGANMLHRARSGFQAGEHSVTFNLLRSIRALVEQFKPTRVVFVLEGIPVRRLAMFPDYKGNRKREYDESFSRQRDEVVNLMSTHFPISVVRHPTHEADDVIFNLINVSSLAVKFTVISTDTDFTQLLNTHDNVHVYNPVKKAIVEWDKSVNYAVYKSLKGDGSDNIPGVPGFGEKKALKFATNFNGIHSPVWQHLQGDLAQHFDRNRELVEFETWDTPELMTSSEPTRDWDAVKAKFQEWEFASIVNDKSWSKFVATFDPLFGG